VRPKVPFKPKGNHHLYHGIWITAFGIFNLIMGYDNIEELFPLWYALVGIGVFMMIDDIIEHTITADTPLRILWEKIYKSLK